VLVLYTVEAGWVTVDAGCVCVTVTWTVEVLVEDLVRQSVSVRVSVFFSVLVSVFFSVLVDM